MQDLEQKNFVYVSSDDDLQTVLSCFKVNQISHVPVIVDRKVVGMISKTDVVEYLYDHIEDLGNESFAKLVETVKAKEVMMQPLLEAKTTDSEMLIAEKLLSHQVSSLILKDEDGDTAGIITDKDLLNYLVREKEDDMSFGEKLGLHMAQWLESHGLFRVSKALSDIGI